MTRRRFIADTFYPTSGHPTSAVLTGDQALHVSRVLRASPGQIYDVVANGFVHRAEIAKVSEQEVSFILHEELESDAALPLHLLLAVFKFDHFEWAVEKATELGVARITPVLASRTEKHLALASTKRVDRWRRIVLEASKQSRRTDIPEITNPASTKQAVEQVTTSVRILLSETEQTTTLSQTLATAQTSSAEANLAIAIGPEGGWTSEEMSLFSHHHWQPVTLGPRILRAETAAVASIAIVSTHFVLS